MRRFTLYSPGGLANRLKLLVSGQVLAHAAGAELEVLWPLTEACRCPFERLFAPVAAVQTVPEAAIEAMPRLIGWGIAPPDLLALPDAHVVLGHMSWLVRPDLFPGHAELWPRLAERLANPVPSPAIQARVDAFAARHFRPRMLGVHLRRGDFHFARPDLCANTEAAMRALERELVGHPDGGIFLATDDGALAGSAGVLTEGVRERMRQRFGERVVFTTPRSLDRATPEAIEDALVDLLLLRMTAPIIGTASSSFSELAAFGRDTSLVMTQGESARIERLERFVRRLGLYPWLMRLARQRMGHEPASFFLAWHAVRYSPAGKRIMRIVRQLAGGWRP